MKAVRDSLEQSYFAQQKVVEEQAVRLYENSEEAAIKYLNEYSNRQAQQMLARWRQLAVYLIVKFNDMAVKPEENGAFKRTATGIGARVARPGFPKPFAREYIRQTGDKYLSPE